MQFIELTTYTTTEAAELVSDLMWNYTNYGVAISDPADIRDLKKQANPKWDYIDDNLLNATEEVLVKCYISKDIAAGLITLYLADLAFFVELIVLRCLARGAIAAAGRTVMSAFFCHFYFSFGV